MARNSVSSLFCNDEDEEQTENEYVFEKNGDNFEPLEEYEEQIDESIQTCAPSEKRKSKKSVTVNIPQKDIEKFEKLKKALWKTEDSAVLKWCFEKIYESKESQIERILKERDRIEEEKRRIGTL